MKGLEKAERRDLKRQKLRYGMRVQNTSVKLLARLSVEEKKCPSKKP